MDWQENIRRWRMLSETEKREIRLRNIPRKVARSMAFEGEPVDQEALEKELKRLVESEQHKGAADG